MSAPSLEERLAMRKAEKEPHVVITAGSVMTPEPVRWLWPGYLARGKFQIVAGAPGTGKTTLALGLAATVTCAGRWPDGAAAEIGSVLIWSGEDDVRDTLLPRLLAMGADASRVHFISGVNADGDHRPFDPSRDMDALAHECRRLSDLRLILIDPVSNAVAGDSHKNTEVRRGLQPLVDMAARLGAAALGISHFAKGTAGRDPLDRVIGSVAFGALPRVVFGAAKTTDEAGEEKRVFVRSKSNIGPDGGGFEYELVQMEVPGYPGLMASCVIWGNVLEGTATDLLAPVEDDGDRTERTEAREWLQVILADGPMPAKEVQKQARDAGLSWATVRRAQKEIGIKPAKTRFDGGWEWSLPKVLEDAYVKNVSTLGNGEHLGGRLPKVTTNEGDGEHLGDEVPKVLTNTEGAHQNKVGAFEHLGACPRCAGEGCGHCEVKR